MLSWEFSPYLYEQRFILRTGHASLTWLCNFKEPEGQLARWIEILQDNNFEIVCAPPEGRGHKDSWVKWESGKKYVCCSIHIVYDCVKFELNLIVPCSISCVCLGVELTVCCSDVSSMLCLFGKVWQHDLYCFNESFNCNKNRLFN